jgi:two-component system sensor histidine kinase YesM
MPRKIRRTVRLRISLITVSFSLIIAVFLATLSFLFFQNYARRSVVQSTEFNLQLVAGTLGQHLNELETLVRWCATNTQIAEWLAETPRNMRSAIPVYDRLRDAIWNNRSNVYVRRLIVTDTGMTGLLQVGNTMSDSRPVTIHNIPLLGLERIDEPHLYRSCTDDPYALSSGIQVFPVVRPITRVGSRERIGYVYLAASVDVLLDQLVNYPMPEDSSLYLTLPDAMYRLDGERLTEITSDIESSSPRREETLGRLTLVNELVTKNGGRTLLVSYPVAGVEGAFLSQSLSARRFAAERRLYFLILALIAVTVVLFGLFILVLLNRIITRPVRRLRRRIDAIAGSDFSRDPGIEWNDELGDIGRGINEMAGKIVSLMETRLADEKNKRDLEYRMLQSQINPHFLYNTLNSIKWMAKIQHADGIAEMTTALSRLMRNAIKSAGTVVPLSRELELLDDYFLIQQYRYGGAITFEKHVPPELGGIGIPCFTLQPLLENAIFHGIEPKGGTGRIALTAAREDDGAVRIEIEDDGVGMSGEQISTVLPNAEAQPQPGFFQEIGIASVDKRLRYSFGRQYGLEIESVPGRYTRMRLRVPFAEAPVGSGV